MTAKTPNRRLGLTTALACLFIPPALAVAGPGDDALFDLSLDELLSLEVTSVSKKTQSIAEAAAPVFVITNEDIRRSGVSTVPDALRMVPGVQVAQVDANKWAISARGFSGRFANKLLVMMDGRSLYTPLFSGVFWDVQDVMLEDVDRIEVIRGPGSTLWGANAVNGVINIITKSAAATQGTLLSARVGDHEHGAAGLRFGDRLGELGHYRVYANYFDRDGNRLADTGRDAGDAWYQGRIGFRADLTPDSDNRVTIQGDAYRGESGETMATPLLTPPYVEVADRDQPASGFNVLARWTRQVTDEDEFTLQTYFDRTRRTQHYLAEDRYTVDVDFDYRTQRFTGHDLLLGLGYRRTVDEIDNTDVISVIPDASAGELFSAFIQDDITLVPDRWSLILGSKFEHNDYTGFEYQPNVRLLWTPDERRSLWASATRSVRTPGRVDRHLRMLNSVLAPGTAINPAPFPLAVYIQADDDNGSEVMTSYEAGFKFQANRDLAIDVAIFHSEYDNLRSFSAGGARCQPAGILPGCLLDPATTALLADADFGAAGSGQAQGFELVADWRPQATWRLQAAYSYLDVDTDSPDGVRVVEEAQRNPQHQLSLRAGFSPRPDVDVDFWLRHMDDFAVSQLALDDYVELDSYTELDMRIAWRPHEQAEIALVGRNLLDSQHVEFYSETSDLARVEIERSFHLQLRYRF